MGIEEALLARANQDDTEVTDSGSSGSDLEESQESLQDETSEEIQGDGGEYNPNYGFSVRDEQKEFDEWIRPSIKDPETEEKVRELYTKAYGLDYVKTNLETEKEKAQRLAEEAQRYREESELAKQGVEGLKKLAKEDFSSFAHLVGLDDSTILSYANHRLDYREKPEHERRLIDQDIEVKTQSYTQRMELEQLKRQNEKMMISQHQREMQQAFSLPEIAKFKDAFDKRMGREGSFEEYVKQHGSNEFKRTKQYVPPLVATQAVYNQFKPLFVEALEQVQEKETASGNKSKPPTNLGSGRTTAVVTKRIKSLKEMRKRANELARSEGY